MAESGQSIADAIVVHVESQAAGTYSQKFSIVAPDDPQALIDFEGTEQQQSGTCVFVVPVGKRIEKLDRGGAVGVHPTINVFVSKFLDDDPPQRKEMNAFVDELEGSLRFIDMNSFVWEGAEIITLYDPERLRTQDRFFSVFGLLYWDLE